MSKEGKGVMKIGGFTILSGLGGTLVAGLLAWVFSTTLENKITFAPLTVAIDNLTDHVSKQEERGIKRDEALIDQLREMTDRMNINETKLFRVILDCNENEVDIKNHRNECNKLD